MEIGITLNNRLVYNKDFSKRDGGVSEVYIKR